MLWDIRNEDKFYFESYGKERIMELLIDCVDHCYNVDNYKLRTTEDKVDNYLESINCA